MQRISETNAFIALEHIAQLSRTENGNDAANSKGDAGRQVREVHGEQDSTEQEHRRGDGVVHGEVLCGLTKNSPIHIRAKSLAAHASQGLDVGAKLNRGAVLAPLIGGLP